MKTASIGVIRKTIKNRSKRDRYRTYSWFLLYAGSCRKLYESIHEW